MPAFFVMTPDSTSKTAETIGRIEDDLIKAVVVASAPPYGLCIVSKVGGSANTMGQLLLAYLGASSTQHGVSVKDAPTAGQIVYCKFIPGSQNLYTIVSKETSAAEAGARGVIDMEEPCLGTLLKDQDWFNELLNTICTGSTSVVTSFDSWGKGIFPPDMLGGDLDVTDAQSGVGLRVSRLLTSLRASGLSYLEVSQPDNSVLVQSEKYRNNTLTDEETRTTGLDVFNSAATVGESLGYIGNKQQDDIDQYLLDGEQVHTVPGVISAPFGEATEGPVMGKLRQVDEDAIPFYRMQDMRGAAVGGEQKTIVGSPSYADPFGPAVAHNDDTVRPPVLSTVRRGLDGSLGEASARRITLVKSNSIYAPTQYKAKPEPEKETSTGRLPDVATDQQPPTAADANTAATGNLLADGLLTGDWMTEGATRVLEEAGYPQEVAPSALCSANNKVKLDTKEIGGSVRAKEYSLPQSITLTDPVTGEARTYFASTSFITMEADGSVVISDGYGSEIRMSRGNIYISSALDTHISPGRDMSVMAGGTQAYLSRKGYQAKAATVDIGADRDMKLAGGLKGEQSSVLVENSGANGSLNLVSRTGEANLLGRNIYIARKTSGKRTQPGDKPVVRKYADFDKAEPGGITLDAGTGPVSAAGGSVTNSATGSITSMVFREDEDSAAASVLQMGPNSTALHTGSALVTGTLSLLQRDSDIQIELPSTDGAVASRFVLVPGKQSDGSSSVRLQVQGGVLCDNLLANSSMRTCGQLIARSIGSLSGQVGTVPETQEDGTLSPVWIPVDINPYQDIVTAGAALSSAVKMCSMANVNKLMAAEFYWPKLVDAHLQGQLYIPSMRWQKWYWLPDMKRDGNVDATPAMWKEAGVQSSLSLVSYPYPGEAFWSEGKILKRDADYGTTADDPETVSVKDDGIPTNSED